MKQPEEVKREFTRQWLEKAEGDYKTSGHLLPAGKGHLEAVTFHSQQASEKYLKALLVWHQIEFPKTHDLDLLLKLVSSREPELATSLADAGILTPYGVEYRYPGEYPDVTMNEAQKAFEIAGRVRKVILKRLPHDILS
jgi:HEPN domain-containing protein